MHILFHPFPCILLNFIHVRLVSVSVLLILFFPHVLYTLVSFAEIILRDPLPNPAGGLNTSGVDSWSHDAYRFCPRSVDPPLPFLVILAPRARSSFSRFCRGFFVARIPRDLWRMGLWDPWVDREGCKIVGDSLICRYIYFPYIFYLTAIPNFFPFFFILKGFCRIMYD